MHVFNEEVEVSFRDLNFENGKFHIFVQGYGVVDAYGTNDLLDFGSRDAWREENTRLDKINLQS